jgi:hypothetical protein
MFWLFTVGIPFSLSSMLSPPGYVLLGITKYAGTSNNATLASMLRSYYISFATSLDPNAIHYTDETLPYWPLYQSDSNGDFNVLNVTYGGVGAAPDNDASPQCDFFHSQSYIVRN